MKVIHLSYSDFLGGASLAALRIHKALCAQGIYSRMYVNRASGLDSTVVGPKRRIQRLMALLRPYPGNLIIRRLKSANENLHSLAVMSSFWHRWLNRSHFDLIHLHWINNEMISIPDIGRLKKPIVWTLHDMWAFCGAEHYTEDARWRQGYSRHNRPGHESGPDINRWVWKRKVRHWKVPMHIVAPSHWLADCARQSALMRHWPISVIPNCIDTSVWVPVEKPLAKNLLGLPEDVPVILFGAQGGSTDKRKGYDLLQEAICRLRPKMKELQLVVFGESGHGQSPDMDIPIWYAGRLHDVMSLRILYSAADVMVIPSRQDNLPNTGLEAHACATPVAGFDIGGLSDIVVHKNTGYLATPFDSDELAHGIEWIIKDGKRHKTLCQQARSRAVSHWSNREIASWYKTLYEKVAQQEKA